VDDLVFIAFDKAACMSQGSKEAYTSKQKRQARHIEKSARERGASKERAEEMAWRTVNKQDGGAKRKQSGGSSSKGGSKGSSSKGGSKGSSSKGGSKGGSKSGSSGSKSKKGS
jgi:hypothetical protein